MYSGVPVRLYDFAGHNLQSGLLNLSLPNTFLLYTKGLILKLLSGKQKLLKNQTLLPLPKLPMRQCFLEATCGQFRMILHRAHQIRNIPSMCDPFCQNPNSTSTQPQFNSTELGLT